MEIKGCAQIAAEVMFEAGNIAAAIGRCVGSLNIGKGEKK